MWEIFSITPSEIQLKRIGSNDVGRGSSLTLTFTATAPGSASTSQWTTRAFKLNKFDQELTISGSQATVSVVPPDSIAPVISEVTPVPSPTKNSTPSYTFSTTEAGTITYGGSCTSTTSSANVGTNTLTLSTLADEAYSNCTVTVKDAANNVSNILTLAPFIIDTTAPVITINPYNTAPTNTDIVVTASTNE